MKRWSGTVFFCVVGCALLCLAAEPTTISPEDGSSNEVRPTGVPHRQHSKTKSKTTSDSDSDANASPTPRRRKAHRTAAKSGESEEPIPSPKEKDCARTRQASSVIVINRAN